MAKVVSKKSADEFSFAELTQDELVKLLGSSDEYFIEYFLADQIAANDVIQDFHLIIFKRFTDLTVNRDVIALPRDHAKTTYLRLAVLKMIYHSPLQFFVFLGVSQGAGTTSVQVVRDYMLSDEAMQAYGAPVLIRDRISEGYLEYEITAYDEDFNPYRKFIILKAQGVQQAMRGMNLYNMRPQYVAADDIEDETAVKTKEGYEKLKAWFDNTFMRAVSREEGKNKVSQIGNLIGVNTLLNDNLNDPDWRAMRFAILRPNGQPLWPSRFSLESIKLDLMRAKRRNQLTGWFGELMNMPLNLETALCDLDHITYTPLRHVSDGHTYKTFITIDPAISLQDAADDAAVVLHTIDDLGVPQVSEYIYGKLGVEGIVEAVRHLCNKWNCNLVGCESVQLQGVLLNLLQLEFINDGNQHCQFVPINTGRANKTARLRVWTAALTSGEYSLPETDIDVTNQLSQFDVRKNNNRDDLIDACSMGMHMLKFYGDLIFSSRAAIEAQPKPSFIGSSPII